MSHLIAPSILNADFLHLQDILEMLNKSEADYIHLDIMDGRFVPNLTFGFPIIKQINKVATKPLDVHLMIVKPDQYLKEFRDVGADILTVHYEACEDLTKTLREIKSLGMKASASVKPGTAVSVLKPYLAQLDMILIMTVEPGYGGQAFMEESYERVRELKVMIEEAGTDTLIEVDGGVGTENIGQLIEAGVDVFVVGSTIFRADDPEGMIRKLKGVNT
jgi:ribulose-phosphate 3-epimerase